MRIAVISIVYHSTPPRGYGGIERVVYTFVEQLIKEGHDVTLFATSGSYCSGKTIAIEAYDPTIAPSGWRRKSDIISEEALYLSLCSHLDSKRFDIIHDWSFQNLFVLRHPEKMPFIISTCIPPAPDYRRPNLVACSRAHAALCGPYTKYVHYGLDLKDWDYSLLKQNHFIHLAKIARFKGQHLAMLAARRIKADLRLAGIIENQFYFYTMIKPLLLLSSNIRYIGEIQGTNQHLKDARALIQTPQSFDPFPLVILEALASGTPVIGIDQGGVAEQIENGVTGFLCKNITDLMDAMQRIREIRPQDCRDYVCEHFSIQRMVRNYIQLYQRVLDGENW